MREHRLYQADWLMRFYGFDVGEIVEQTEGMLSLDIDPKLAWGVASPRPLSIDINRASREDLLRVPGFGTKAVERIIATRRFTSVRSPISPGCTFPATRRCRSSCSAIIALHRICWMPPDSSSGSSRNRHNWGSGFEMSHHYPTLESETDFDGWRQSARALILNNISPSDVTWRVQGNSPDLFEPSAIAPPSNPHGIFTVPAKFVELAQSTILNRDPERFALLYRLLWRLRGNPDLLMVATDPDVARIAAMAKAVRRDEHKMHAFVRFREIGQRETSRFIAWFEPEHHIVELAAPFFAKRFADMAWSILTPDACAHWDGDAVAITAGVSKAEAPSEDRPRTNLAQLLRQHLQPGTAEGESDANRNAEEILAEPAGGLID